LNAPSLQGLSAEQLARLGHTGGQIIGRNSQGLNARAQWLAEQQARAAAQQAARQGQGMSPDEAYARYMAGGSRSSSYQRALGENYRTTWHTPAASRPGSSALTQTLSDIAARTAGAITGTAGSFADMAEGSWRIARNSALQVGDILTFGYNHDHPAMQQAWSEQQQLGQSIVNAMLSPREASSRAIESVVNRYEAAMAIKDPYAQSQALGRLFNDVGQAALGLGYSSASLVKPGAALARAIGENASTGPTAGSRRAQLGGINTGSTPKIPPVLEPFSNPPQSPVVPVDWVSRPGKTPGSMIYHPAGTDPSIQGSTYIRVMPPGSTPVPGLENGYWIYVRNGQPLNPATGGTGTRGQTHVPLPPDGMPPPRK